MRARPLVALACLSAAAVAAGCGGGDEPRVPPARAVELDVTSPEDLTTVRTATVDVQGTVAPAGAEVRVLGKAATVSGGGTFTARVALDPGDNVIDVMATARGRGPALTAFRVAREVRVDVPDLDGLGVADAEERLGEAGLGVEVETRGGPLEDVLPFARAVCEQSPEAGTKVARGTTVRVVVGKTC